MKDINVFIHWRKIRNVPRQKDKFNKFNSRIVFIGPLAIVTVRQILYQFVSVIIFYKISNSKIK